MKKIYVGNLSFRTTEDSVRGLFAKFGTVHSVKLISDKETGKPKGFGFVEMDSIEEAISSLDGKEFEGRVLKVNEAKDKPRVMNKRG